MIRALYDYAMSHPDILTMPGCALRSLSYIVDLDKSGQFLGIRKSPAKKVLCPDAGGAVVGTGGVSNVIMEKASIVLGFDPGVPSDKMPGVERKRACFLDYFRDDAQSIPEFQSVLNALTNSSIFDAIYAAAEAAGVKYTNVIGFSVDGKLLSDLISVRKWWADITLSKISGEKALDIVTGEVCVPARLFKQMPGDAVGAPGMNVAMISFNNRAFESYGQSQGANCSMSQVTADAIMDAIIYLGLRAPKLSGMKFVHWYDGDLSESDDVIQTSLFDLVESDDDSDDSDGDNVDTGPDLNSDSMDAMADNLIYSPIRGECPVSLVGKKYHIIVMEPAKSRLVIRKYQTGDYSELYNNLKSWFDDMALISSSGRGMLKPRGMNTFLLALLTQGERKSKSARNLDDKLAPLHPFLPMIMRACMDGSDIPDPVCRRAVAANQSCIYNKDKGKFSPIAIQWMKLCVCRKERLEGKCITMPELNRNHENPAYHCGRLLACYDSIQRVVMPDVKSGLLTKFYSGCSQRPALILGQLQALSVHHFKKIKSHAYAELLETVLSEAWSDMPQLVPEKLRMVDWTYFAIGYWQQLADLNKRVGALREELARKKAEKGGNNNQEDDDCDFVD